jgi:hypothetical protein
MEASGQLHGFAAVPLDKGFRYPLNRLDGSQGRVGELKNFHACRHQNDFFVVQHVAWLQYRQSYFGFYYPSKQKFFFASKRVEKRMRPTRAFS